MAEPIDAASSEVSGPLDRRDSQRYDTVLKQLIALDLKAWFTRLGFSLDGVKSLDLVNSEVRSVISLADRVIRVRAAKTWLLHLELQVSYDPTLPRRLLEYNVHIDAHYEHRYPVRTVVVLLKRQAWSRRLTGRVERVLPDGFRAIDFAYDMVKVWEIPVATILDGDLATLPLAPVTDLRGSSLPQVVNTMSQRIAAASPTAAEADRLWLATLLLMGLRYTDAESREALKGMIDWNASSTYRSIIAEGLAEGRAAGRAEGELIGARVILLRLGTRAYGPPSDAEREQINQKTDLDGLLALIDRVEQTANWRALLASE